MKKILLIFSFGVFSLFFSQYTEQINTSSFNNSIIPPSTHIDGLDEGSISYQNMNSTEFINNKRENNKIAEKYENINHSSKADKIVDEMFPNRNKIDITSTKDIRETHEQVPNSNIWTPKTSKINNEEIFSSHQYSNKTTSLNGIIITIILVILFLLIFTPLGKLLFALFKNNRKNYNKIIVTNGGESEMREFIRTAFKKTEEEIRKNESFLSNSEMRERIIEVVYNISKDLIYPQISKFKIKYKISEAEARQIIDDEIIRFIIMLE